MISPGQRPVPRLATCPTCRQPLTWSPYRPAEVEKAVAGGYFLFALLIALFPCMWLVAWASWLLVSLLRILAAIFVPGAAGVLGGTGVPGVAAEAGAAAAAAAAGAGSLSDGVAQAVASAGASVVLHA